MATKRPRFSICRFCRRKQRRAEKRKEEDTSVSVPEELAAEPQKEKTGRHATGCLGFNMLESVRRRHLDWPQRMTAQIQTRTRETACTSGMTILPITTWSLPGSSRWQNDLLQKAKDQETKYWELHLHIRKEAPCFSALLHPFNLSSHCNCSRYTRRLYPIPD